MDPQTGPSSARLWRLARAQHGVVTRYQLLALGYRPRSAAAAWGICAQDDKLIEVSVQRPSNPRPEGIAVYRRVRLTHHDVTRRHGIPVTNPICTLVDLAVRLPLDGLEAAVNEADKRDLMDPEALRASLQHVGRRPGDAVLRKLLDRRTFTLTDSQLERRFLPLARAAALPSPQTGKRVSGFRVDFYWPNLRLVVETDGLRYPRTAAQQARGRLRDQAHIAAGLTPLRFTHAQVAFDPDHVKTILRVVARQ